MGKVIETMCFPWTNSLKAEVLDEEVLTCVARAICLACMCCVCCANQPTEHLSCDLSVFNGYMMESEFMRCTDTSDACMYIIYVYLYHADINLCCMFCTCQ